MPNKVISLILVVLISAIGCFAQTYEEQQRMEEQEKRLEELGEQVKQMHAPQFAELVRSFLPAEKGAWTISISRSGGFLGNKERLIGLVNSKGAVACDAANRLLPDDSLGDLSNFIQTNDFKSLEKTFSPAPSFCSDCYVTTLTLNYRSKKNKIKTYQYSWAVLPDSNSEIVQLYEKAKNFTSCQ